MSSMFNTKEQHISQDETRRIIISDMVKKRNSIVPESSLTSMMVPGYCGLSLLPQFPFGVPLVLLELSYRSLNWIRSAFEEGSKVMWRYTPLTNICALANETGLVAPRARFCRFALQRTYVHETMNLCNTIEFINNSIDSKRQLAI